jgi:ankyrin repeat protein
LNTACATGNIQMVRMLLNNWATPNFQTLSFACNSGARTIVRALLSHFISPPVNPNFHYEPHLEPHLRDTLHPQGFNYLNVADLLIENGHVPTIHSLYSACKFGNSEKVRLFLRKGVQPDEEALRLACYSGNAALAQGMLIVYLMIYKQELKNPSSLLVAAFKSGNRALIKELKDRGFQLGQGLRKWCIDPYLNITITPMTTAAMTLMLNPRELINSNAPASVSFWADFYPNPPNPHLRNPWSNFEYSHLLFCCYTLDKLLDKLKSDIFDDKTVELAYMAHEAAPRQFFLKISHTLAHADEYQLELSACEELAALVKIVIIGNPLRYSSVEKDDIKQSLALAELEAYQLDRLAQLLLLKEIGKLVFSAPQSASTSAAVSTAGASTAFLHSPITAAGDTHANLLKLVMPIIDSEPDFFKPFTQALDEKRYSTALRRLCTSDKSKIFKLVEILLRFKHILKIDLNERVGNDQRSVLHFAARHSTAAVYDLLLKEGADPNREDRARKTPVDYFQEHHNFHTLFSM